jgi:hypothetical protein
MVISALTVVVLCATAMSFARRNEAPVPAILALASSALAWGGGFLQAVSVAIGALLRDRTEGIFHLCVSRTISVRSYVIARVGGLSAALAAVVGGGTLLVGACAILVTPQSQGIGVTVQSTLASVVHALAFSAVIGPVALATLGARTRASGYFLLIVVLFVPEILAAALAGPLPSEVTELFAIPSALGALRSSLSPGSVDFLRCLRALVALSLVAVVALAVVRREVALVQREVT